MNIYETSKESTAMMTVPGEQDLTTQNDSISATQQCTALGITVT